MSDTQRDREERQHVIEVLKSWDGYFIGYTSDEVQEALRYAIASIETDLRYDLLYEETSGQADKPTTKNDLGVDAISRTQAQTEIEMNASRYTIARERGGMGQVEWSDQLIKVSDAVNIIRNLPPVTPQEPRWIPVSEYLPVTNDEVLVTYIVNGNAKKRYVETANCYDGEWSSVNDEYRIPNTKIEIIAWCEMPKPYSEVKE